MTAVKPFPLDFQPGIQRDGTRFDAMRYLDGQWVRWRLGRPRKMGGYQQITSALSGQPRRIHCFYQNSQIITHIGTINGIQQVVFDRYGNLISITDRTPFGFIGGADTSFTMDAIFDTTSGVVQLVVHAGQNASSIASTIQSTPFLGPINGTSPLYSFTNPGVIPSGVWVQPSIAGGIVCVQPFVFDFDSSGLVQWSAPNLPNYLGVTGGQTGAGQARISAQKIVAGIALRGGGAQQPAALFWSLSEVIVAVYVGATSTGGAGPWFAFSTVSPSSSILSSACVIEYDGLYFWAGVDRFLVFNGAVSELPNPQNQDYFFNNLTPGFEQLTFAFKVPRYGEIWWCACMFGATSPNHAIIYNIRENCWYDTPLPDGGRTAGYFAQGFPLPIMTDNVMGLWMHETGTDKVIGNTYTPIRSYYETAWFGGPKNTPPDDRGLSFQQIEPDFVQTGDMSAWLIGAANARAPDVAGPSVPLLGVPGVPQEQLLSYKPTMPTRLLRLHVESNVLGGSYIGGRSLARATPSEPRVVS